jgi:hypothetical protein
MGNKMLKWICIIFIAISANGCKKAANEVKKSILVDLMTSSNWTISKFLVGADAITPDFSGYEFQFNKDGSMFAIKAGNPNVSGTWAGDEAKLTIQSNFPGAAYPLNKLNGTWALFYYTLSVVKSNRTDAASVVNELNLLKK